MEVTKSHKVWAWRLTGIGVLIALVFVVLAVVGASGASAAASKAGVDPTPTPANAAKMDPIMVAQIPLVHAGDAIQQLVRDQQIDGLAGLRLDHANNALVVYWKGPLPATVASLINQLRASVVVQVLDAPYSEAELDREAQRISHLGISLKLPITGVGALSDFSGLEVTAANSSDLSRVKEAITSSMKLKFSVQGPTIPFSFPTGDRWNDISPYWGGDAIERPLGNGVYHVCSTSFAVHQGSVGGILTAAHCGTSLNWYIPDSNNSAGETEAGDPTNTDSTILTGETYEPVVYSGAYDQGVTPYEYVQFYETPDNGMLYENVYVDGAGSGNWVAQITSVDQLDSLGNGPGFWTADLQDLADAGAGDSGGPTYALASTSGYVDALGFIDGGDPNTEAACRGWQYTNRVCTWGVFHVNVSAALVALGATLDTY